MFFIKRHHQFVQRLNQFRLLDLLILVAALSVWTLMANLNRFSVLTFTLGAKDILGLTVYFVLQSFFNSKCLVRVEVVSIIR